jgi:hypothetical protein
MLRRQVEILSRSPAVGAAYQMTRQVSSVLEPVWDILDAHDPRSGVGHLRDLGSANMTDEVSALNEAVLVAAVQAYGQLNLVAPSTGAIWRSLSRPSVALIRSVSAQPRQPDQQGTTPAPGVLDVTVRPSLPARLLASQDDVGIVPALRTVLRSWCDLAWHASGERRETARLTLAAAMLARGAVLDGDTDTVTWFVDRWLGLQPTSYRIDGTSAALLEDGWVQRRVDEEFSAVRDAVTSLRIESIEQHRMHRPVWQTQLRGSLVGLLNAPVGGSGFELIDAIGVVDPGFEAVESTAALYYIRNLPEKQRTALVLISEGYPYREIAEVMGHSVENVRTFVHRARKQLAEELGGAARGLHRTP